MKFRPCIDIHDGKVKQIVGGSLNDSGAKENFASDKDSDYYAGLYKQYGLKGGHIILLNKVGTEEYEATKEQALLALRTYPDCMQVGGGITSDNAKEYIDAGASHVIVTSYIFEEGKLSYDRLNSLREAVGSDHIVLDLSCRKKDGRYYVVVDRWQTFTDLEITKKVFEELSKYCDEFLIHGVDVEGKKQGIDTELLELLAGIDNAVITYAGGIRSMEDIDTIEKMGSGKIDFTIGSALSIFGGDMKFEEICERVK